MHNSCIRSKIMNFMAKIKCKIHQNLQIRELAQLMEDFYESS